MKRTNEVKRNRTQNETKMILVITDNTAPAIFYNCAIPVRGPGDAKMANSAEE